jgi:hypothetical protein
MRSGLAWGLAATGALAAVVVLTAMHAVPSQMGQPIHEKVAVSGLIAQSSLDGSFTVLATLPRPGDCLPSEVTVTEVEGGYALEVERPGPGQFNDLTCLIIGSVTVFTADSDPVGTKVTVNGRVFTVSS